MSLSSLANSMLTVSAVAALIQDPNVAGLQETLSWLVRGMLALGLAACAYLLREAAQTMKSTKEEVGKLAITVATHQIMFEHWVDTLALTDDPQNPGRRLSDKLIKEIVASRRG